METFYTDERNTQILIGLMKAHKIKKVVASPGTTNICLVASLQQDSYFEIYSSVDERSAAYIACGLAAESGEAVALSCTGATASRNYLSGLTEAFYRKLPILAITSTQHMGRVGHNIPQVIDRSTPLNDIAKLSVQIPTIHSADDEWAYSVMLNKALLALNHHGGGPVHVNLTTTYSENFSVRELPTVKVINRICYGDSLPDLKLEKKVGIFVGNHKKWESKLTEAVDTFCEIYDGVVLCDHTSNYKGKYRVNPCLLLNQERYRTSVANMDVLIHIGDISGAYVNINAKEVWRVNPDGEIRDTFQKLRYVFEMEEKDFFESYIKLVPIGDPKDDFLTEWKNECKKVAEKVPDLPFSNAWIARNTVSHLPENSVLHLGILNSLRAWNFYEMPESVLGYSNTGGFGIDGILSSLLGASLTDRNKLYFGVIGDLAFFYDMNALGNRHVANNLRLIIVNNGCGAEFQNYNHKAARFGDEAKVYMAAAGHYGNKSPKLIQHYTQDLGFEYLCASTKEEYLKNMEYFLVPHITDKPIVFEVFTDSVDESNALKILHNLEASTLGSAKQMAKEVLGEKGIQVLKKFIK